MKKKILCTTVMLAVLFIGVQAQGSSDYPHFMKGSKFLSPQVGLNSWAIPFGASIEYGMTENIGIGVSVLLTFWGDDWGSSTLIIPVAEAFYHFTKMAVNKLDLFAGAGIGFGIYSYKSKDNNDIAGSGTSEIMILPTAGARYWLSNKLALYLKVYFSVTGGWSGLSGIAGVSLPI